MVRPALLTLAVALAAVACSGGGSDPAPTSADPTSAAVERGVVVGVVMAETGRWSEVEVPLIEAVRAEVDRVNEGGGVAGSSIDLRVADSESTLDGAVSAARSVFDLGARLLVVGCDGDVAAGAALIGQESAIPVLSPCASANGFGATGTGPLVHTLAPPNAVQGEMLAELAFEQTQRRVAIISEVAAPDSGEVCSAFEQRHVDLAGSVATDLRIGEGGTPADGVGEALAAFEGLDAIVACVAPPLLDTVLAQVGDLAPVVLAPLQASVDAPLAGAVVLAPATGRWDDLGTAAAQALVLAVDRAGGYDADEVVAALDAFAAEVLATGPVAFDDENVAVPAALAVVRADGSVTERSVPGADAQ